MHQLLCQSVYSGEQAFKQLWSVQQHDTSVQLYSDLRLVRFSTSTTTTLLSLLWPPSQKVDRFLKRVCDMTVQNTLQQKKKKTKTRKNSRTLTAIWSHFDFQLDLCQTVCHQLRMSNEFDWLCDSCGAAIFTAYLRAAALTSIWCVPTKIRTNQFERDAFQDECNLAQAAAAYRIFDEWHKSQSQQLAALCMSHEWLRFHFKRCDTTGVVWGVEDWRTVIGIVFVWNKTVNSLI